MTQPIPTTIPHPISDWIEVIRNPKVNINTRENYAGNLNNIIVFLNDELKAFDRNKKFGTK